MYLYGRLLTTRLTRALQQEIERLNQRRAEREKEAILREQEQMQQMRFAESAQMAAWIDKEDDFHLEQAKKRAEIRVRERRAKPIDYLALNLKWSQPPLEPGDEGYEEQEEEEDDGAGLEVDLEEPYAIFDVRVHLLPSTYLHPLWLTSHATRSTLRSKTPKSCTTTSRCTSLSKRSSRTKSFGARS